VDRAHGAPPGRQHAIGQPGLQPDGTYITPEGDHLTSEADKATYLRTAQDWIVAPLLRKVGGLAGVDSIGGYVKQYLVVPDLQRLAAMKIGVGDLAEAIEANNVGIGAGIVNRYGDGLAVRSDARVTSLAELARIPVATREGVPILLDQVASVRLGQELRMGSASENGEEVVVGTAIMRVGENSRNTASAVAARLAEINASLPMDVSVRPVLDRTALVNATIDTVARNLGEGALLVVVVLFAAARQCPCGADRCAGDPDHDDADRLRHAARGRVGQSDEPRRARFRADRRWRGDHRRECAAADRRAPARGRASPHPRRAARDGSGRGARDDPAIGVRPGDHHAGLCAAADLSGVEGKTFTPMALTVIIALAAAFLLSISFVPAAIAIGLSGPVEEKEGRIIGWLKHRYRPGLDRAMNRPRMTTGLAIGAFALAAALFTTLGQEFLPQLDEGDLTAQILRVPGTSIEQSQAMQSRVERQIARLPEVRFVFSKTGTAEVASDPMPPNISDTFIMMKPRAEWPDPGLPKSALVGKVEKVLAILPGHGFEISQPIQMRFNELIAGVRGDLAVKIFGDDPVAMGDTADRVAGDPAQYPRRRGCARSSRPRGCRCSTSAPIATRWRDWASRRAPCRT
jgi:cobalt-zinc-cadmium resistance protein CzcA